MAIPIHVAHDVVVHIVCMRFSYITFKLIHRIEKHNRTLVCRCYSPPLTHQIYTKTMILYIDFSCFLHHFMSSAITKVTFLECSMLDPTKHGEAWDFKRKLPHCIAQDSLNRKKTTDWCSDQCRIGKIGRLGVRPCYLTTRSEMGTSKQLIPCQQASNYFQSCNLTLCFSLQIAKVNSN